MKSADSTAPWLLRLASTSDVPALEKLIAHSVRVLHAACYSRAQIEAALGDVFAVDNQLIRDGTYFVAEKDHQLVGCGGWSQRRSLCGGDAHRSSEDSKLDPACDAARIRAFFIHPAWARRGIGRALLTHCENAIRLAGYSRVELAATLAGEPLYAACGYHVSERYEAPLSGGLFLPVVRMVKTLDHTVACTEALLAGGDASSARASIARSRLPGGRDELGGHLN